MLPVRKKEKLLPIYVYGNMQNNTHFPEHKNKHWIKLWPFSKIFRHNIVQSITRQGQKVCNIV